MQSRSAETVRIIVEAAARILEERGFAGYTTNAVAERAGVSIGSLYQYFPAKQALTVALIERETALLLADIAAAEHRPDGRSAVLHLIAAAVRHQMRRPVLARLLDFEERRLPLGEDERRISDAFTAMLVGQLARLPALAVDDLHEASTDVLAMVKGLVDAAGERGETDPGRLEVRVGRAVFGYLGQPPGP
ncbi:TetR/AcrR family transcriptional regulator [Methylobacterium sp. ID0610]|uniref:TetR/AcrR family transcriptional regulator n=1 Tax=Methylobacterium carpenticola TaxID=3344827 RepID=UPI00368D35A5